MASSREYMVRYMARLRKHPENVPCACGARSHRVVGTEGICAKCDAIEDQRAAVCERALTAKKWSQPEAADGGERFWKEKLEFWLPNPTPGWGSLELLERMLNH